MSDGAHISGDVARELVDLRAALDRANALLDAVADDIGGDYLDLLAQEISEQEGSD